VVVPTLDEAATLPRLVASLEEAGPGERPEELLVVDGGSRDGTPELARALGARVLSAPQGRGSQLARGAAEARGELLFFLHADACLMPAALRAVRASFDDPATIAVGLRQRIDHPGRIYRWIERAADRRVRAGWVYGDSGLCVRRSAYEAAGGFRDQPLFEDLDLTRRLRALGAVRLVPEAEIVVSARRWEREGVVRRTLKNWCLTAAWAAGVAPARLARYYPPEGSSP
jgi:rSAM/selenodomain-associated transferase 2